MLPNFMIIGAEKSATSWLAGCLGEYPDVFMVKVKEIYFFNAHFERGLAWYESYFDDWSGQKAIGEATPNYLNHPDAPARIQATLGNIKMIVSLRHPVDRAYSAFWHYARQGKIPPKTDFYTFFRESDQFTIRSTGCYNTHLSRYFKRFPREILFLLIYEEIFKDSRKAVSDCLEFLGLNPEFEPSLLDTKVNRGARDITVLNRQAWQLKLKTRRLLLRAMQKNLLPARWRDPLFSTGRRVFEKVAFEWGPKQKNFERLDPAIRQELLSYYLPDIKQLEDLLGRDLSIWYESSKP